MNKVLSILGMCKASNNLVYGEKLIKAISSKNIFLVLLAEDTSLNTKKKIGNKCSFYNTKLISKFNKNEISNAIGMQNIVAVGILNKNLAIKINQELEK